MRGLMAIPVRGMGLRSAPEPPVERTAAAVHVPLPIPARGVQHRDDRRILVGGCGMRSTADVRRVAVMVHRWRHGADDGVTGSRSTCGICVRSGSSATTHQKHKVYEWPKWGGPSSSPASIPTRASRPDGQAGISKGYEKKSAYGEYHDVVTTMKKIGAERGCGRAMWENNNDQDKYGTPMALMLLPFWTNGCIGSMEGLYFEASEQLRITSSPLRVRCPRKIRPTRYGGCAMKTDRSTKASNT